jgi:hypothetical protein
MITALEGPFHLSPLGVTTDEWWGRWQAKLLTCVKRVRDIVKHQPGNSRSTPDQLGVWYQDFWGREFGGRYLASKIARIKYLMLPKSGSKQARQPPLPRQTREDVPYFQFNSADGGQRALPPHRP